MLLAAARMGERALEKRRVPGGVTKRRLKPGGGVVRMAQNVSPIRSQRAAENQVQGFSHTAEPSVEKKSISARPIR